MTDLEDNQLPQESTDVDDDTSMLNQDSPTKFQLAEEGRFSETVIGESINDKNSEKAVYSAAANIFSSTVASGILGLPFVLSQVGVPFGVLGICLSGLFGYYTSDLVIRLKNLSNKDDYMGMAKLTYGSKGAWTVTISMLAANLGSCLSAMIIIGISGKTLAYSFSDSCQLVPNTEQPPLLCQSWIYPVIAGVLLLPLSYATSLQKLESLSIIKFFALGVFGLISIGFLFVKIYTTGITQQINYTPQFESVSQTFGSLCILTLSCSYQYNLLSIYKSQTRKDDAKFRKSIKISTSSAVVIYILVALAGYYSFGEGSANLLQCYNKGVLGTFFASLLQGMFFISCLLTFPINFFEARNSLKDILQSFKNWGNNSGLKKSEVSNAEYYLMTFLLHFFNVFVGSLNPNLNGLFSLLGATASNGFVYIFPCAFYLYLTKKGQEKYNVAYNLLLFGFFMMFAGLWSTFA